VVIHADGKGYYDYLPALYIYNDLNFGYTDTLKSEYYDHKIYNEGINPIFNGKRINKYYAGTSLLMTPFFAISHARALHYGGVADGYSKYYQDGIKWAGFFYLWLSLLLLRKLLEIFGHNRNIITILQMALAFCTPLLIYAHHDASFSHIYSLTVNLAILYLFTLFLTKGNNKYLYFSAAFIGLAVIIRPTNILILLSLPVIYHLLPLYLKKVKLSWRIISVKLLVISLIAFIIPLTYQLGIWYVQTGKWFVYAYGQEGFNFNNPQLYKFLFSYQKGIFVYTPVLFAMVVTSVLFLIFSKQFKAIIAFLFAFLCITYILSSWHAWTYGASYGSRAFIEFIPLILLFVPVLTVKRHIVIAGVLACLFIFPAAALNTVQAYQYKNFILLWDGMDKDKYWRVFCKTDDHYFGILYNQKINYSKEEIVKTVSSGIVETNTDWVVLIETELPDSLNPNGIDYLCLDLDACITSGSSKLIFIIDDMNGNNLMWYEMWGISGFTNENVCETGRFFCRSAYPGGHYKVKVLLNQSHHEMSIDKAELMIVKKRN
jgi:hypothetical protein